MYILTLFGLDSTWVHIVLPYASLIYSYTWTILMWNRHVTIFSLPQLLLLLSGTVDLARVDVDGPESVEDVVLGEAVSQAASVADEIDDLALERGQDIEVIEHVKYLLPMAFIHTLYRSQVSLSMACSSLWSTILLTMGYLSLGDVSFSRRTLRTVMLQ